MSYSVTILCVLEIPNFSSLCCCSLMPKIRSLTLSEDAYWDYPMDIYRLKA